MSSVKKVFAAGATAATMLGGQASAADMPQPPIVYQPAPVVVNQFDGWYLRGDIGITNQQVKSFENVSFATAPGFAFLDEPAFDSGLMVGLGVGYQYNDWLRFDITGEYRGKTRFTGLDRYTTGTNDYTGSKSEWLFLANAYVDLGTWWCITPFIGAGVGLANITISNFRDNNILNSGGGYAADDTKNNFAWALHAGLAYNVSKNFTVEFAYRYLNLGDAQSGDLVNLDGSNTINNPMIFKDITSHDFKLGLRWLCCEDGSAQRTVSYAPKPVYTQPAPVLAVPPQSYGAPPPPPVYTQPQYAPPPPPLSRRG
ncbi:MAG: porin family protein [Pseudorhodoplanes sp.]|nr:MAG: porin family protein [Pseudorhodoplanes sp.]